jgi:hypothetical protein
VNAHARLSRFGAIEAKTDGGLRIVFSAPSISDARDDSPHTCNTGACGGCHYTRVPRSFTVLAAGVDRDGAALAHGDRAELSVAVAGLSASATWAFGVPLAGLLGGAWAGAQIAGPVAGESASIALGLGGLVMGLAWFRRRTALLAAALAPRVRIAAQSRDTAC